VKLKAPKCVVLGVAFLAAPLAALAQKAAVVPLVPPASWRLVNSAPLGLDMVGEWGGDPVIEREYGVKSLIRRVYQYDNQAAEALFEEAADASSAYGLLTYYQNEAMIPEKGLELAVGPAGSIMARGRYFIRVPRPARERSQLSDGEFHSLLAFIAATRPQSEAETSLPAPLPESGRVPGSEKYILGPEAARRILPALPADLIGFSQGAEVKTATYVSGKDRARVVAIAYPTPQIARVRFGAMEHFLSLNQDHGPGSLYGKRRASFVFLFSDAGAQGSASRLMNEFDVSQHVVRNEKYPGDESIAVQLVKLILANLVLVGILAGGATLVGTLIFISRKLAEKWFPESAWARPEEGRIIKLNLS